MGTLYEKPGQLCRLSRSKVLRGLIFSSLYVCISLLSTCLGGGEFMLT